MTSVGSTGGGAPTQSRVTPRIAQAPDDIRAMGHAFARAGAGRPGAAGGDPRERLGLGKGARGSAAAEGRSGVAGRSGAGKDGPASVGHPLPPSAEQATDGEALRVDVAAVDAHGPRHAGGGDDADQPSATVVPVATAQAPVQPVAVPDMPAPHVDPAVFAQLMTQLWLRERGKGAREVRVSFGQDAWPATGARIVRNAAGGLDVQLHVGDAGAAYGEDMLDGLSRLLGERGLAIGAVQLAEGAVG